MPKATQPTPGTWTWLEGSSMVWQVKHTARDMWTLMVRTPCGVTAVNAVFSGTWGQHHLRSILDAWKVEGIDGEDAPRYTHGRYDTMGRPRAPEAVGQG